MNDDPHDLQRFIAAQRTSFHAALTELTLGEKRGHWMWFIFPQLAGLGRSPIAERYAIRSREEACAYLDHPLLGARLRQCAQALLGVHDRSIRQIMGSPDDVKLCSSMTLFDAISPQDVFADVLARYYAGRRDEVSLRLLASL